jgi:hypothetical protein
MEVRLHCFYSDQEENIYRCIAIKRGAEGYTEVVMEMMGDVSNSTLLFSVFYRNNWAYQDRENPEFRLTEEVFYTPHVVRSNSVDH